MPHASFLLPTSLPPDPPNRGQLLVTTGPNCFMHYAPNPQESRGYPPAVIPPLTEEMDSLPPTPPREYSARPDISAKCYREVLFHSAGDKDSRR